LQARAAIPGTRQELHLYRRGEDYAITIGGVDGELMNSRMHASEDALAELGCAPIAGRPAPQVLIGGLGMGFTLAAALRVLGPGAQVTVAELVPEVAEWNRGDLGACAGRPLDDPRAAVVVGDVSTQLRGAAGRLDAVLLDVDNGPGGLTSESNSWLYSAAGLKTAARALRPGGALAVWSAHAAPAFAARFQAAGFGVQAHRVRERPGKGAVHTVWVGVRGG
jgi:spermidine synthase